MSSGRRPAVRGVAFVAVLLALAALAASFVRARRAATESGQAEWPPFEPHIVPNPEPAEPAAPAAPAWIEPGVEGTVPATHPVKVKVSSGIYHVPGGRFYERTTADRLYPTTAAAEADGYRPSKS